MARGRWSAAGGRGAGRPAGGGLARAGGRLSARQAGREAAAQRGQGTRPRHRQLAARRVLHRGRTRPGGGRATPLEPPQPRHLARREHRRYARGRRPQLPTARSAAPRTPRARLHHGRGGAPVAGRAAGRPDLHRRAPGVPQSAGRHRTAAHRAVPQPVPGVDRRPDPRRHPRLDPPRRPGRRRGPGLAGRDAQPYRERGVRRDVRGGRARRGGRRRHRCARCAAGRAGRDPRAVPARAGGPPRYRAGARRAHRHPGRLRRRRRPAAYRVRPPPLGARRTERGAAGRRAHPCRR